MHCVLVEPHLAAYVDGELDAVTCAQVERHIEGCRRCREAVRDMRLASAVLAQWHAAHPLAPIAETLTRRIRDENLRPEEPLEIDAPARTKSPGASPTHVRRGWFLAAAALLLAAVASWMMRSGPTETPARPAAEAVATIGRSVGKVESVAEAGVSRFVLDAAVGEAWASPGPSVGSLVPLEVAATLAATATGPEQAREIGEVLRHLGEGKPSARARRDARALVASAGDWARTFLALGAAYGDEPSQDLGPMLEEALKLEESGDLEIAADKYRQAAEDRLLTLRASILQANVEMKLGRAEAALLALDRAMALTKPDTFYREVVTALRERAQRAVDLRKRIETLQAQLLDAERDFDLLSDIGGLQVKAGDVKGAEETFDRLARTGGKGREKDVLRARLVRAWCRRELNRSAPAFEEFDRLVVDARRTYPEVSTLAQFERAKTLQLKGRPGQALDDYRDLALNAAALGPAAFAAVQFQVGYLLLTELGRPDEAARTFRSLDREGLRDQPFARAALSLVKDAPRKPE